MQRWRARLGPRGGVRRRKESGGERSRGEEEGLRRKRRGGEKEREGEGRKKEIVSAKAEFLELATRRHGYAVTSRIDTCIFVFRVPSGSFTYWNRYVYIPTLSSCRWELGGLR